MWHLRGYVKCRFNGHILKPASLHKLEGCVLFISAKRSAIASLRVIQSRFSSTNWIHSEITSWIRIKLKAVLWSLRPQRLEKAYVILEEPETTSPLRDDSRVFIINSIQPEFVPYQGSRDASLLNQCRVPINYLGSMHQFLRSLRSRFHCILTKIKGRVYGSASFHKYEGRIPFIEEHKFVFQNNVLLSLSQSCVLIEKEGSRVFLDKLERRLQ